MKKLTTVLLALMAGGILEGIIVVLALVLGVSGTRFGPSPGFSTCVYNLHLPGIWIADQLPYSVAWLGIPMVFIVVVVLWSVIAFFFIRMLRRSHS